MKAPHSAPPEKETETETTGEKVIFGELSFSEAKRIQALLATLRIAVELGSSPENCDTRNCAPKLQLCARTEDLPRIREVLAADSAKNFEGLEFDRELLEKAVFDPSQETATCPACATQFSTSQSECPDCGLGFSAGPGDPDPIGDADQS